MGRHRFLRPRETPPTLAERIRRGLNVGTTVGAVYALFGLALRAFPTSRGVRYGWSPSFEEAFVAPMVAGSVAGLVVALLQTRRRS